jgi:hypothetical protein
MLNWLLFFKVALGCAAYRTLPIIRHILPFGPGSHAVIWITLFWVVDIPTDRTYVPVHCCPPFVYWLVVDIAIISKSAVFLSKFFYPVHWADSSQFFCCHALIKLRQPSGLNIFLPAPHTGHFQSSGRSLN